MCLPIGAFRSRNLLQGLRAQGVLLTRRSPAVAPPSGGLRSVYLEPPRSAFRLEVPLPPEPERARIEPGSSRLRDEHFAGRGRGGDPGGDVDVHPVVIASELPG